MQQFKENETDFTKKVQQIQEKSLRCSFMYTVSQKTRH